MSCYPHITDENVELKKVTLLTRWDLSLVLIVLSDSKLTLLNCYNILSISLGSQEGGGWCQEVVWIPVRCAEFGGKVEQATRSVLKALKSKAWMSVFWCHLLRLESNVIKGETLRRKQQWLFGNESKKRKVKG